MAIVVMASHGGECNAALGGSKAGWLQLTVASKQKRDYMGRGIRVDSCYCVSPTGIESSARVVGTDSLFEEIVWKIG